MYDLEQRNQGNLVACRNCGRTFNEDRIEKHGIPRFEF